VHCLEIFGFRLRAYIFAVNQNASLTVLIHMEMGIFFASLWIVHDDFDCGNDASELRYLLETLIEGSVHIELAMGSARRGCLLAAWKEALQIALRRSGYQIA